MVRGLGRASVHMIFRNSKGSFGKSVKVGGSRGIGFFDLFTIWADLRKLENCSQCVSPETEHWCQGFGTQAGADIRVEVEVEKEYYHSFRHVVERYNGGCGHDVSRRLVAEFCRWWMKILQSCWLKIDETIARNNSSRQSQQLGCPVHNTIRTPRIVPNSGFTYLQFTFTW